VRNYGKFGVNYVSFGATMTNLVLTMSKKIIVIFILFMDNKISKVWN
jgi:hypothetical protein